MESLGFGIVYNQQVEIFKSGNRYYYWSARNMRKMPITIDKIKFIQTN